MMSGYLSTRTTLCLLAGLGALTGGVAGAAIVGKLATDGSAGAAVQRDKPAAVPRSRATQVAAAGRPKPLAAADAVVGGRRDSGTRHRSLDTAQAARRHASHRRAGPR